MLPQQNLGRVPDAADWPAIRDLLKSCGLPIEGAREHLRHFLVVGDADAMLACVGLESHGGSALLRSLAVAPEARGEGLGRGLAAQAILAARGLGARCLVLRTETAADFFGLFGFRPIAAEQAPAAVRASAEFRGACPESCTTLMMELSSGCRVRPALAGDMPAVLEIYNHEVRTSTSTYQDAERTLAEQLQQWELKQDEGHAFFVAEDAAGRLVGYANYGLFRPREGWRFSCEHAVYVHPEWRGRGLARLLLPALICHARRRGFHTMVGVVDTANRASMRLHEAMGFQVAGVMKQGGFKFGHWLDVAFVQILL
ncbi:arsenic resistance N-acetyltransferase ArsN2 [Aquabacterium sp. A7-Y]|uniref:arsenic resistance N-acetyltransferase ArsN2 n=1 Tax=Aquabacterium sp. A7-Y TaxID=1349605 RepID=UPI00223E35CA|nr:arsenic resistance N-acetyltransferase ArsN2 [Aquabacterium sp. A7-Y]MCW7536573.1 arsenic resistance N-acetyltransferase ArsN2 [Aquabacterium sp. A7-Y]